MTPMLPPTPDGNLWVLAALVLFAAVLAVAAFVQLARIEWAWTASWIRWSPPLWAAWWAASFNIYPFGGRCGRGGSGG